jgi:hypothetical protein
VNHLFQWIWSLCKVAVNKIGWVLLSIWMFLWLRWQLIVVIILYGAVVWAVAPSKTEVFYVATQTLDRNHRLLPDDIGRPTSGPGTWGWFLPDRETLEGKYVTECIPAGEAIEPARLQLWPDLTIDAAHRLVIFLLDKQPQLSDFLNANSYVDVMGADAAPVAPKVRVHAVVCPKPRSGDKTTPACYALLAVSVQNEPAVSGKIASLRLVPTQPPKQ